MFNGLNYRPYLKVTPTKKQVVSGSTVLIYIITDIVKPIHGIINLRTFLLQLKIMDGLILSDIFIIKYITLGLYCHDCE